MRISPQECTDLDLEVHRVLRGVPLNDVSAVDLPGGGAARTIDDVRALLRHPVSRWTSAYMALIEPFRRFIVYPSILRQLREAWRAAL
ncbi:hypothetical protein BE04_16170 [Sorangium cellulosum]|uniref:Uncharacterized protein n=2 Tax=Sorangium cellulosum TaxID=56 RepID=A0A150PJ06_SORCE|nr:hypothetical protein [Sorangium cellulosum]AGP39930.1 hypothetical protein SCE1572_38810 [Sorangium cellulosum So0157-2]KYF55655.1 hypothetical protein BE04_16170 [Sorangium cellulosum]